MDPHTAALAELRARLSESRDQKDRAHNAGDSTVTLYYTGRIHAFEYALDVLRDLQPQGY